MAVKALTLDKTINYVCEDDPAKGTDGETVFALKALPARLIARIRDHSTRFQTDKDGNETNIYMDTNTANLEFVRYGLKSWTNFVDDTGSPIQLVMGKDQTGIEVVAEESLNRIPSDIQMELAHVITGFNTVDEDTRKN